MSTINKAIIVGNLGEKPIIRTTQQGARVASFSIATSEKWNDKKTGDKKEITTWHKIVIFNENLVEIVDKYLTKGNKVYIEGSIQTRKYEDKNKIERYITEIIISPYKGVLTILKNGSDSVPPNLGDSIPHMSEAEIEKEKQKYLNKVAPIAQTNKSNYPDIPF